MQRRLSVVLVLVTTVLLAGCSVLGMRPSPTTTYTDANGETVTVDWKDFPATEGSDAEALLDAPDQAEVEASARQLVNDLRDAVEEAAGTPLVPQRAEESWFDDEDWSPQEGNGYGGEPLLTTVNCCRLSSDRVPDLETWQAVVDAASRVTQEAGLGPLVLEHESGVMADDPDWRKEYREQFCNVVGGGCWSWSAVAADGYRWIILDLQDASLDPTGDGVDWAEELDLPVASITLDYGATVVRAGMKPAYETALAPFRGLEQPEPTRSD
jgi:hypothetical protein